MRAASLNFRDIKIIRGTYARQPILPIVILSDGAGDVITIGKKVKRFSKGDRVMPIYMSGWHDGSISERHPGWKGLGGDADGTARTFAVFHEEDVVCIPNSLSYEQAACIPCAGVTAWHALITSGQIKAGDDVLILGSGGVSVFGLQISLMNGARVIAISSNDNKLEKMRNLGASVIINYNKTLDWDQQILLETGNTGVDHVLEVVGEATMERSINATAMQGSISVVGDLCGTLSRPSAPKFGIRMSEIIVGSRTMMEQLVRAITLHNKMPVIDRVFPFIELKDALRYLERGVHVGKVVISFD
tara:strand:+ start:319 stop:1227 length:909 start_codon:yes stop_codon:yes gene_type:complete